MLDATKVIFELIPIIKNFFFGLLLILVIGAGVLYSILPPFNIPLAIFRGGIDADSDTLNKRINVPDGFRFTLFAKNLSGARFMRVTPAGDVLLTIPRTGDVYLLYKDADGDGKSDGKELLLSDLEDPHGVELTDGWLYIAEIGAVGRIEFDYLTREITGAYAHIFTDLPIGGNHTKKAMRMGPDGWLYINVGSSCNACLEEDARRSTLMRIAPDGSRSEIFASGLRNSMGFDWSPRDGSLYATNNGRDLLGDDYPLEELNCIEQGKFYGWPFINEYGDPDPDFGDQIPEGLVAADPVHTFDAHNAPLGITFLRSGFYPADFHHDALVALHGSWNRREKDGYKVVRLSWDENGEISQTDFMTGLLLEDDVIGRPVDVTESPDGSIYVSDDFAGSVYRLAYGEAGESDSLATEQPFTPEQGTPATLSTETKRRGRELYANNICATCHSEPSPMKMDQVPLKNLAARYDQKALVALFKSPPSSMPPVILDDEELNLLAEYLLVEK